MLSRLKKGTSFVYNKTIKHVAAPLMSGLGNLLMIARAGSAVNTVEKLGSNLLNEGESLNNPVVVITAIIEAVGAGATNRFIRYHNMMRGVYRKRKAAESERENKVIAIFKEARLNAEVEQRRKEAEDKRPVHLAATDHAILISQLFTKAKHRNRHADLKNIPKELLNETKPSEAEILLEHIFQEFADRRLEATKVAITDEETFTNLILTICDEFRVALESFIRSKTFEKETAPQEQDDIQLAASLISIYHEKFKDIQHQYTTPPARQIEMKGESKDNTHPVHPPVTFMTTLRNFFSRSVPDAKDKRHQLGVSAKQAFEQFYKKLEIIKIQPIASFWNTGIKGRPFHLGYLITQILSLVYLVNSGLSGFLGGNSFAKLGAKTLHLFSDIDYNDTCGSPNQSSSLAIGLVTGLEISLALANVISFLYFNKRVIQIYFPQLFMNAKHNKGWREFSREYIVKSIGLGALGAANYFWGNTVTYSLMATNILCHPFGKMTFDPSLNRLLSAVSALNSFYIQSILMTWGAHAQVVFKEIEAQNRRPHDSQYAGTRVATEFIDFKEHHKIKLPTVKPSKFITVFIGLNVIQNMMGIYLSIDTMPQTWANASPDLLMKILVGIASTGISLLNAPLLYSLDNESRKREEAARLEDACEVFAAERLNVAKQAVNAVKTAAEEKYKEQRLTDAEPRTKEIVEITTHLEKVYRENGYFKRMAREARSLAHELLKIKVGEISESPQEQPGTVVVNMPKHIDSVSEIVVEAKASHPVDEVKTDPAACHFSFEDFLEGGSSGKRTLVIPACSQSESEKTPRPEDIQNMRLTPQVTIVVVNPGEQEVKEAKAPTLPTARQTLPLELAVDTLPSHGRLVRSRSLNGFQDSPRNYRPTLFANGGSGEQSRTESPRRRTLSFSSATESPRASVPLLPLDHDIAYPAAESATSQGYFSRIFSRFG